MGYKLPLTETATEDAPDLITDVALGAAATPDSQSLPEIQKRLGERGLQPTLPLADPGYTTGSTLKKSADAGISLLGPVSPGTPRTASRFGPEAFKVTPETQEATCPNGDPALPWASRHRWEGGGATFVITWDRAACGVCPLRSPCLTEKQTHRRLTLSEHYSLLDARRQEQTTETFRRSYRRRNGIEATFSPLVNVLDGRQTPYRGKAKTLLH